MNIPPTSIHKVEADGVQVFYRAAGDANAPAILLLHGFPTSSFMFRELIPRLADQYRVIAPDLPVWFQGQEIRLTKWDRYAFAHGVVWLAFVDLMPSQQRLAIAKQVVNWADATVDVEQLRK